MTDIKDLSMKLRARVEVYGQINGILVSTDEAIAIADELDRLIEVEKVLMRALDKCKEQRDYCYNVHGADQEFWDMSNFDIEDILSGKALKRADEIGKGQDGK